MLYFYFPIIYRVMLEFRAETQMVFTEYPLLLPGFHQNWNISTHVSRSPQTSDAVEIVLQLSSCHVWEDGRADTRKLLGEYAKNTGTGFFVHMWIIPKKKARSIRFNLNHASLYRCLGESRVRKFAIMTFSSVSLKEQVSSVCLKLWIGFVKV